MKQMRYEDNMVLAEAYLERGEDNFARCLAGEKDLGQYVPANLDCARKAYNQARLTPEDQRDFAREKKLRQEIEKLEALAEAEGEK